MASPRPNNFNSHGGLPNGSHAQTGPGPNPSPSHGRVVQAGATRVLCVADVRGNLRSLNDLAKQARADFIVHTGDFGFYDDASLERITDKTLRHVAQYSPLISEKVKDEIQLPGPQSLPVKQRYHADQLPLSELTAFIDKTYSLTVPVYTVWGACEDVRVLEKFRSGEYKVDKLHIIDEANSRLLDVGGVKLRLLGLGGAVVMHKLFDNGDGRTTIAGGQGTMWTTLLQMGELVDTANRVYDPTETRVFVTHASPAREGLLNQLSVTLKADFSISAGLHFRYGSSYNEFSVNPTLDHYRGKLAASKASFNDVWETVKSEVEPAVAQHEIQQVLLQNALDIVQRMPSVANGGNPFGGPVGGPNAGGPVDESAFKNMWNFNLADAAFGYLVLEIDGGRIGTEMKAQGFNFAHRGAKHGLNQAPPSINAPPLSLGSPTDGAAPPPSVSSGAPNSVAPPPPPPPRPVPSAASSNLPLHRQLSNPPPPQRTGPDPSPHASKTPGPPFGPGRAPQSPVPAPTPTRARARQDAPAARNYPPPPNGPAGSSSPKPTDSNPNAAAVAGTKTATTEKAADKNGPVPDAVRNGTATTEPVGSSSPATGSPATNAHHNAPKNQAATERKATPALFVGYVNDEETCRALFTEEDRSKITRVEKNKSGAHVVFFESMDDARVALDRQPLERKKRTGEAGQPLVKLYLDRPPHHSMGQGGGGGGGGGDRGAGRWPSGSRGGGGGAGGGGPHSGGSSGYQSAGGANSDGEGGGRGGRGGFRGGPRARADRPRGGRGGNNNSRGGAANHHHNNPTPQAGSNSTPHATSDHTGADAATPPAATPSTGES